ncbi:MAG: Telomerase protein component 1 [Pleopsidium flavum]|nr:MAG: Telomerase protein component 1 [Pleopsidium flavum]
MAPATISQFISTKAMGLNFTHLFPMVLLFVVAIALKRRYFSPISDIPGPFLASFSVFWKLWHIIDGHNEERAIALHKEHGDFVRISHNEVSVSHPDAVSQLLLARVHKGSKLESHSLMKRLQADFYQAFAIPDHRFPSQMSERDPKEHVRKYKNVSGGFALSNILKSEPFIDTAIELLKDRLNQLSQIGEKVHFDRWFNFCAFDVVGEITFSRRFGFLEEGRDIGGSIANTRKLLLYISLIGHAYWLHGILLGNPIITWLNLQPFGHILETCVTAVAARKENDQVHKDMMEQWTEMRRTYPDRMEEKEILAAVISNVAAGADTISTTLQALFYYLLRHPKHLLRLQEEMDSAHDRGELSRIVSHAEAQKLPFLQACIKEAYRIHPAVSFSLPRVAGKEGITIAGRVFPEGTILSVHPWVMHHNTSIFGKDADSFNPERWLDQQRAKLMDKYLIHWGAGYNQCPGRNIAHLEVSKISATLLRDYNFTQVDPKQDWTFVSWFVALPANWPCYVTRRNLPETASLLRQIVAGPRLRDSEAGLDLCYVTDYIIATSGPSSTYPQRAYRNPTDALVKFLDHKHKADWAIWEFRAEGTGYPDSEVHGRIHHYPWPDHHPPPFALIPNMMASMRNWLKDPHAPNRVVVVHCKAGKGRSGTVACSYLISEEAWTVEEALKRFTERRMRQGFGAGVSIPSQLRWVGYVHRWTKHGKLYVERQIEVMEVHVWGLRDGVKVAIEGFVDEGKTIKTFHVFTREERIVVDGTAQSKGVFADLAGLNNEKRIPKTATSSQLDDTFGGKVTYGSDVASSPSPKERSEDERGAAAVIFRPSTRVILPTNDINIDFERRNKAAYGWTMVTAVAHVWFNAFFEGQGAENRGKAAIDGVFEIEWDAMDGIKGSSRKGIRALDRVAVVWRAVDAVGEGVTQVIIEPPAGEPVPEMKPADWKGAQQQHSTLGRDLGLRTETPVSAHVSKASSIKSVKSDMQTSNEGNEQHAGVRSHGLAGEEHIAQPGELSYSSATAPQPNPHDGHSGSGTVSSNTTIERAQSPEALDGIRNVGLASVAGIVSGMKHVSTGALPDGKPESEMKTSHAHIPGHLQKTKDVGASS